MALPEDGRLRPVIEHVRPSVEGGRYPAKAVVGETACVSADVFADGHDLLSVDVCSRHYRDRQSTVTAMTLGFNDHWEGTIALEHTGRYQFWVRAGVDRFGTWSRDLQLKVDAGQEVGTDLMVGRQLLVAAARRAKGDEKTALRQLADRLRSEAASDNGASALGLVAEPAIAELVRRHQDAGPFAVSEPLDIEVDRPLAGCSAWYELFPRSASPDPDRPGTLQDVIDRLGYVSRLGFDVLYLPPIHPLGTTNRKGRDGSPFAEPEEPGSPWAIGSSAGGHDAIDPGLGTFDDFDALVKSAQSLGIEVALDLAFQCSPNHPWVHEHPRWFKRLPDGSIRFAENPPKRYEDIYPLDFETDDWVALWHALLQVTLFWVHHGVNVFRVDNPHTKPLRFWQWLIASVRAVRPEVVFLAEAFTRPRVMEQLAKVGFQQSYTYFTWRITKWELEQYLTELTQTEVADYFRPNFWPNTPDILHEVLQHGGRAAFMARLILAATMSANYGIYGPAFELQERVPRRPGSEEYLHSEKYEVRYWDLERRDSLADLIARLNHVRHTHPALRTNRTLRFHVIDNEQLIVYSKTGGGPPFDTVLVIVNLDPYHVQSGWTSLDLDTIGMRNDRPFTARDLLTGAEFSWQGPSNFVLLDPDIVPAHVLRLSQHHP